MPPPPSPSHTLDPPSPRIHHLTPPPVVIAAPPPPPPPPPSPPPSPPPPLRRSCRRRRHHCAADSVVVTPPPPLPVAGWEGGAGGRGRGVLFGEGMRALGATAVLCRENSRMTFDISCQLACAPVGATRSGLWCPPVQLAPAARLVLVLYAYICMPLQLRQILNKG